MLRGTLKAYDGPSAEVCSDDSSLSGVSLVGEPQGHEEVLK